jgi:Kef-type K+ transport system membrane component KefB
MDVMASTTRHHPMATTAPRIRWGRVVVGAIAIEALLVAVAVPMFALLDNPFVTGGDASGDFTTFFALIAVACFLAGAVCARWVARPLTSRLILHGALTGTVATALYLALCSIPPTTIASVYATYGAFWFLLANGLRIVGATLGAAYR